MSSLQLNGQLDFRTIGFNHKLTVRVTLGKPKFKKYAVGIFLNNYYLFYRLFFIFAFWYFVL